MRTRRYKLLQRTPHQHYTPDQIEYIYEAAMQGLPMQMITKKLKTTHNSVRSVTRRHDLSVRHIRDTYTLTRRQLAAALAISQQQLKFLLKHHDLKEYGQIRIRWLSLDEVTTFLKDQRFWWRWQPQHITLDWLRELATEIRSQPVSGVWLPSRDAATYLGIGWHAVRYRIKTDTMATQRLGNLWLVWCPRKD